MAVHVEALWTPEGMDCMNIEPGRAFLAEWYERDGMWPRVVATFGQAQADAWIDAHGLKRHQCRIKRG